MQPASKARGGGNFIAAQFTPRRRPARQECSRSSSSDDGPASARLRQAAGMALQILTLFLASGGFELDRGVGDAVAMHQLGANARQQGIVKGGRPFREVSGQRDLRRAERPDVQVMNPVDFGET